MLVFSSAEMTNSELCRGSPCHSRIEVEDAPGFGSEIRIPGKDPTTVLPRTKGIGTQPTPESCPANLGDNTLGHHLPPDIGQRQPRERQPEAMRQLTGEGFYLHDDAGGERGRDGRPEAAPRGLVDALVQIVCATCSRSGAACPSVRRSYRWACPARPRARF